MDFSVRAKSEGVAIFFKSVLVYLLVWQGMGLLAYAIAQLVYSLILLSIYAIQSGDVKQHFKLHNLPVKAGAQSLERYVLPQHQADLWNFTKVCVLKFIVSEGEKIMIFYFTRQQDNTDQTMIQQAAELGLISNLISIVCRFVFQPLEEIAYNMFSKLKESKEN